MDDWQNSNNWKFKIWEDIQYKLVVPKKKRPPYENVTLTLKCMQKNYPSCPGKATLLNGNFTITVPHTRHGGNIGLLDSMIAQDHFSHQSSHTLMPTKSLFDEIIDSDMNKAASRNSNWTNNKLRKIINKSRLKSELPSLENSLDKAHDILNSENWNTLLSCQGGYLTSNLYGAREENFMVLFDQRITDQLINCTKIHISSSSYKLPDDIPITEVLTISALKDNRFFKNIWFFVSRKSRNVYNQIVEIIKQKFPASEQIFTNWDNDLVEACHQIWPNTHSTWYSYAKALRHQVNVSGIDLTPPNCQVVFRKLVGLPILPARMIAREYLGIVSGLQTQMPGVFEPILNYIQIDWLNKIGVQRMTCKLEDQEVAKCKIGWYESLDETLIDSEKGIKTQQSPSFFKYLEYIIGANEQVLKDLKRDNHGFSIFSPILININTTWTSLEHIGLHLRHELSGQRALAKIGNILNALLFNLISRPQPLPVGFTLLNQNNDQAQHHFDINMAIHPMAGAFIFHEESVYVGRQNVRIPHQQVENYLLDHDQVQNEQIDDAQIQNQQINNGQVQNNQINHEHLQNQQIDDGQIQNQQINNGQVQNNQINHEQLQNQQIDDGQIPNDQINHDHLQNQQINNGQVQNEQQYNGIFLHEADYENFLANLPVFMMDGDQRQYDDANAALIIGEVGEVFINNENEHCKICRDENILADRILHCNHVFCLTCIQRWALRHRTCPLCRAIF